MRKLVETMLERLSSSDASEIISWAAPVPSFGNLQRSSVATLGINPSNREFVDENGVELTDGARRFHTLGSLSLPCWSEANESEVDQIVESCNEYFFRNPYSWFKRLDPIVASTGSSYYDRMFPACHIDLLPFATDAKWGSLPPSSRKALLKGNADLLRQLIQASRLDVIILNGQSVVSEFEAVTGIELDSKEMVDWALPRSNGNFVPGIAYTGLCDAVAGEALAKPIKILGFNHNIQSSYGVTTSVVRNIAAWVGRMSLTDDYTRNSPQSAKN